MRHRNRDPLPSRLTDAILSLQPTAYWPLDDGSGPLRDLIGRYPATVTGSPTFGVAAPSPIGRGVTWSGTGQYATTATSVPTPTASFSAMAIFATTDATAATRYLVARAAANQYTWGLYLHTNGEARLLTFQSGGSNHAIGATGLIANDGLPHVVVASFDGVTVRAGADARTTGTSTSLTGSWHKASTAGISIASLGTGNLFPGTVWRAAYWADRIITDAERMWLNSVMRGA